VGAVEKLSKLAELLQHAGSAFLSSKVLHPIPKILVGQEVSLSDGFDERTGDVWFESDTIQDLFNGVPLLSVRSHAARVSSWSLISEELESSIPYNLRRSD
jgi:hypothetical protein